VFLFLKAALAQPFPRAGETLALKVLSSKGVPDVYDLRRPAGISFNTSNFVTPFVVSTMFLDVVFSLVY
jgi:hypothetical protein